jgi:hypothetical protein
MTRGPLAVALLLLLMACEPRVTSLGAWIKDKPDAGPSVDAAVTARDARYLEAEDGALSGGFTIEDDGAASNGQRIAAPAQATSDDAPGTARARYRFEVAAPATYAIWGRIKSPDADHNRFWFQLDGGDWHKWRISTGEIWFWDALHEDADYDTAFEFALDAGAHELVIANCVDGVALDRLYVTADGDMPPGNDTPCNPPHSIEVGGECQPSCGSHMDTTCVVAACAGKELLPAYDCAVCCKAAP